MELGKGRMEEACLILEGICKHCRNKVVRLIEPDRVLTGLSAISTGLTQRFLRTTSARKWQFPALSGFFLRRIQRPKECPSLLSSLAKPQRRVPLR